MDRSWRDMKNEHGTVLLTEDAKVLRTRKTPRIERVYGF